MLIALALTLASGNIFASEEDGLDAKHIWTSLLVKAPKVDNFNYSLYTESWNDVEDNPFLWLISNKFSYSFSKTFSMAINYTFLDIQKGQSNDNKTPHQHRFEIETTNKFKAWVNISLRNRFERRVYPEKSDAAAWDFRYRFHFMATTPALVVKWLKLYTSNEVLLNTSNFNNYFTDFSTTVNENRLTPIGFSIKANDNISLKLYPALRWKYSKTLWKETGVLGILLINKF